MRVSKEIWVEWMQQVLQKESRKAVQLFTSFNPLRRFVKKSVRKIEHLPDQLHI